MFGNATRRRLYSPSLIHLGAGSRSRLAPIFTRTGIRATKPKLRVQDKVRSSDTFNSGF